MTSATPVLTCTKVRRYENFTFRGPVPGAETDTIMFKWSLDEGNDKYPLGYTWELWAPGEREPYRQTHGSGDHYHSLLPPDLVLTAEALLKEWPACTREFYPRVPPLPEPIGVRTQSYEGYFDYDVTGAEPFEGKDGTIALKRASVRWTCELGPDRSRDTFFVSLSGSSEKTWLAMEHWSGGVGNRERGSSLPIPAWLWEVAEESRRELLAWQPAWGDF